MSLNQFYKVVGITKQGVHDMLLRQNRDKEIDLQLLLIVHQIRSDHPTMGVREMYFKIDHPEIGRDKFEKLCMSNGLRVIKGKNYRKTTDSSGVTRFDNLLEGLKIERMNQVWQSDITYFEIKGKFYYITLIQDAHTKVIVGHQCSKRLTTEQTTMIALKRALKKYKKEQIAELIFHSDGGGQYYANEFKSLTSIYQIQNSMGTTCYENAMAESLNGVIKNKYLNHFEINSFEKLKHKLDQVVSLYNYDKPHSSLHRKTPKQFENSCLSLNSQTKATMKKSIDAKRCKLGASSPSLTGQTKALNQISSMQ